jgi:hypothetical protein
MALFLPCRSKRNPFKISRFIRSKKGIAYLWEEESEISIPSKTADISKNMAFSRFEFGQVEGNEILHPCISHDFYGIKI